MKSVQKFGEHLDTLADIIILQKNTDAHKCTVILLSDKNSQASSNRACICASTEHDFGFSISSLDST